jgi:glycerol-3-phosphate dehydrogenase (NAD(P)+)
MRVVILGAGNWGTTLAIALASQDREISLWTRTAAQAKALASSRENKKYLPNIKIPQAVRITEKFSEPLCADDVLILAVPSNRVREVAMELIAYGNELPTIITATKGLEYGSFKTMSQVIKEILPSSEVIVLTGPTIAKEIAQGKPAKALLAGDNPATLAKIHKILANKLITFELSNDPVGAEVCGALKGIIAVGFGIADGLDLGANIHGLILTYGLREFVQIANFLSVSERSIYGLAGLADLVTTCLSRDSRNRQLGYLLGKGYPLEKALAEVGMAVEGVNVAKTLINLKGLNVSISIPLLLCISEIILQQPPDIYDRLVNTIMNIRSL